MKPLGHGLEHLEHIFTNRAEHGLQRAAVVLPRSAPNPVNNTFTHGDANVRGKQKLLEFPEQRLVHFRLRAQQLCQAVYEPTPSSP
jgi:hypothetical protein